MKRRDYELIASAIKRARDFSINADKPGVDWAARMIADAFAREKPGFDRDLFLTNCGVQEYER